MLQREQVEFPRCLHHHRHHYEAVDVHGEVGLISCRAGCCALNVDVGNQVARLAVGGSFVDEVIGETDVHVFRIQQHDGEKDGVAQRLLRCHNAKPLLRIPCAKRSLHAIPRPVLPLGRHIPRSGAGDADRKQRRSDDRAGPNALRLVQRPACEQQQRGQWNRRVDDDAERTRQAADEGAKGDKGQRGVGELHKKPLMAARFYAVEYKYVGRTSRQAPNE